MADFTIEVSTLLTANFDFGLDTYPIFSETYRDSLNGKILDFYKYHEIGWEDSSRFKHRLNSKLNEGMPLFNKLYQSELLTINPLLSFSRTNTASGENTANSTGTNTGSNTRNTTAEQTLTNETAQNNSMKTTDKNIDSDTPQGMLSIANIETSVFASKANIGDQSVTQTNGTDVQENMDRVDSETGTSTAAIENDTTATFNNTETDSGYDRPLAELLNLYRTTFLNVDMLVIESLRECFMGIM